MIKRLFSILTFRRVPHIYPKGLTLRFSTTKPQPVKLLNNPEVYYKVPLVNKQRLTHDTELFSFGLPSKDHTLGLPVGQHIILRTKIGDKPTIRYYTPVSPINATGFFSLAIKVYEMGLLGQHLKSMKPGETVEVRGPRGSFIYNFKPGEQQRYLLIAGGSGITPCLQIIKAVLENPEDTTVLGLIYANVSSNDILFKDELDSLQNRHPGRFTLHYTVDKAAPDWRGRVGYIDAELIKKMMEGIKEKSGGGTVKTLFCGPPLMNISISESLRTLGIPKEDCFKF